MLAWGRADALTPRKLMPTFSQFVASFVDRQVLPGLMYTNAALESARRLVRKLDTPAAYRSIKDARLPSTKASPYNYLSGSIAFAYRYIYFVDEPPGARTDALESLALAAERIGVTTKLDKTLALIAWACRARLEDNSAAISDLDRAIALGSSAAEGPLAMAEQRRSETLENLGRFEEAETGFKRILTEHSALAGWGIMFQARSALYYMPVVKAGTCLRWYGR